MNLKNKKIKVMIADDHDLFREGVQMVLSGIDHLQVIGSATNGNELLLMVKQNPPDVILMDINMPEKNGIETTQLLVASYPNIRVLALTMYSDDHHILEMLNAGAFGYLVKNADKSELIDGIEAAFENQRYYCKETSLHMANLIARTNSGKEKLKTAIFNDKEIEFIKLLCLEKTAQEISEVVYLSRRTVEGLKAKIMEKMAVRNTAGIIVYAIKHEIVTIDHFQHLKI